MVVLTNCPLMSPTISLCHDWKVHPFAGPYRDMRHCTTHHDRKLRRGPTPRADAPRRIANGGTSIPAPRSASQRFALHC